VAWLIRGIAGVRKQKKDSIGCDGFILHSAQRRFLSLGDREEEAVRVTHVPEVVQSCVRDTNCPTGGASVREKQMAENLNLLDFLRFCTNPELCAAIEPVLDTLTHREREIIKLRNGIGDGYVYTLAEVGKIFSLSRERIRQIQNKAIRKLQHPVRMQRLQHYLKRMEQPEHKIELREAVAEVKQLSPELIAHLKSHHEHIQRIPPDVFEELIAEFLAARGFDQVKLVGRDIRTSADILAVRRDDAIGARVRYFIEVKRVSGRIGVGVIDRVMGAIAQEKPKWGWHLGMIVSTAGFTEFQKYTRHELELRGLLLKDRDDVLEWLKDYRPSDRGLWLPKDYRIVSLP